MRLLLVLLVGVSMMVCTTVSAQSKLKSRVKKSVYQEVDLEDMIKRYFGKEVNTTKSIEGIYSVSCVITKRNRKFLSGGERLRVVERKDNYARVAILKDWPNSKRDFIEVSMSYHVANKYPIVGEFEALSEANGFIYKHIEPDGSLLKFSMIFDYSELIEGEYSKISKRKTISYRLSYMKIYPKTQEMNVQNKS